MGDQRLRYTPDFKQASSRWCFIVGIMCFKGFLGSPGWGCFLWSQSDSFAQWQYSNPWSNREVLLLLVENYTQYPALSGLNPGMRQFLKASLEAVKGVSMQQTRWRRETCLQYIMFQQMALSLVYPSEEYWIVHFCIWEINIGACITKSVHLSLWSTGYDIN